jgi:hypothetical protein
MADRSIGRMVRNLILITDETPDRYWSRSSFDRSIDRLVRNVVLIARIGRALVLTIGIGKILILVTCVA